jgi:hypothetical protein
MPLTLQDLMDPTATRIERPPVGERDTAKNVYSISFSAREKCCANRAELGLIDRRLPNAIDSFAADFHPSTVPGMLDATLRYWLYPRIEDQGADRGKRVYFSRIHLVDMPTPESIDFLADTYSVRVNRTGLPLATIRERNVLSRLSAQQLEEQYPGSVNRLQMGITLGMDVKDLVLQITSSALVNEPGSSSLPELIIG